MSTHKGTTGSHGKVGQARPRPSAIRGRAILLILALLPVGVYLAVWGNWVSQGIGLTDSLIGPAVAALALIVAVNLAVTRWRPGWALSRGEIIAVYVALVIGIGITASVYDWCGAIVTVITYPIWFAIPENRWAQTVWPYLPAWLTVWDQRALAGLYLGDTSPYGLHTLLPWLRPAAWWTAWTVTLMWVSLCVNVIVRKRWSEEEKLAFPMTVLPLELTDPGRGTLRSPFLWVGIGFSAAIVLLNQLARVYPTIPHIPLTANLWGSLARNWPWDGMRSAEFSWNPWYLGLAYLMPADLTFSLIAFNLLWRAEYISTRVLGWNLNPWDMESIPRGEQQTLGGYLALTVIFLWLDRRYLVAVLRKALGLRSQADDSREAFGYRTAMFGGLLGLLFLWWFLARGGLKAPVSAGFVVLYMLLTLALTRIRAQLGPPTHEMYGATASYFLRLLPGTRSIGPRGLGMLTFLRPFAGEQRTNPAPAQLEGLRMAEATGLRHSSLAAIMLGAGLLALVCLFWANLHVGSNLGLSTARAGAWATNVPRESAYKLESWLGTEPTGPNWPGVGAMGIGFAVTALLMALKMRFPFWPLHPVAFPLAMDYQIETMLPALIIAWLTKVLLLRYGGLRMYRQSLPLFLGFIIGNAVMMLIVALLCFALHLPLPGWEA